MLLMQMWHYRQRASAALAQVEEQQRLQIHELNHRLKNNLTVVRSIVSQTTAHSSSPEHLKQALLGRLDALERASMLNASSNWRTAPLRAVVEGALEAHRDGGNVHCQGPDVVIPSQLAPMLSMVLNELTTNAVKYGALSAPNGRVDVRWEVERTTDSRPLIIDWIESGGPEVVPPERSGFGCLLIERSLTYGLNGSVHLQFLRSGVQCRIEAPLDLEEPADRHGQNRITRSTA